MKSGNLPSDQFGVADLSRMPHLVFLTAAKARSYIRDELREILANGPASAPIEELVWSGDESVSKLPKFRTAMVTKLKAHGGFLRVSYV